eukprot:224785-Rhodomonas_salina.1
MQLTHHLPRESHLRALGSKCARSVQRIIIIAASLQFLASPNVSFSASLPSSLLKSTQRSWRDTRAFAFPHWHCTCKCSR